MKSQHMRRALAGKLWYVHEQKMDEMLAFVEAAGDGGAQAFAAMREQQLQAARSVTLSSSTVSNVAVIPIQGMITQRGSGWSWLFGGSSVQDITQQLRQAVGDSTVGAIVLDIDSPGGDTAGIDELATEIYQARKQKPITAVSNCLCASAAYYLASQASEVLASPSSFTGSIGVYTLHEDDSEMLANAGVKVTLIKFGENKAEGNSFEPLSGPARDHLQEMVDTAGNEFEKAVARGRGIKQDEVHKKFGQGRVFPAKKAVQLGLADRVGTLDDALAKHGAQRGAARMRAESDVTLLAADLLAAEKKTKRVDGEDLEKPAFAYQGEKPEDWHLPIEFSTDEKTKAHIRDAVARWNQTDMPDAEEKERARGRIQDAAKKHDIALGKDDLKGASDSAAQRRLRHEMELAAVS